MSVVRSNPAALAIQGGQPVRQTPLPYARQWITEEDIQAVVEVLRSDWITTGPTVEQFEEAFAASVGATYAVSFSSGTAALHGAAFAAGLGAGDEAITTPLTFCATANCVLFQGARPVFADVCPDTLNLDPEHIARRISPRTKAILPVDYAGHPADLDAILALADRHGLVVIEDACQALGATHKGRRIGSLSHLSAFSFHATKAITTGEGGMVTTDRLEYARRLRMFRNHGLDSDARQRQAQGQWTYEMTFLGYNYRLTDFQCALGLRQLRKLPAWIARRQEIARRYHAAFSRIPAITPLAVRPEVSCAYQICVVQVAREHVRASRDELVAALRAEGIGATVHYPLVPAHPYYRQRVGDGSGQCPIAERAAERILTLPLYPAMSDQDVDDVVRAVEKTLGAYELAAVQ